MLVLSRQRDESIIIGDDVEITVVDIRGDKVRLGITAPTKIAVHRKEVYEAIRAENQRAAASLGQIMPGDGALPGRKEIGRLGVRAGPAGTGASAASPLPTGSDAGAAGERPAMRLTVTPVNAAGNPSARSGGGGGAGGGTVAPVARGGAAAGGSA